MDAGSLSSSATTLESRLRCPLQELFIQRKSSRENLDRFIPNRSAMDFGYAHYMLTEGAKGKENPAVCSPSRNAYRTQLAEAYNMNRTRILAFKNKPPAPLNLFPQKINSSTFTQDKTAKPKRHIPQAKLERRRRQQCLEEMNVRVQSKDQKAKEKLRALRRNMSGPM